ncbi:putative potassium channel subfamily K member 13-like [Scophthalmus maximus]|uniref:Putative potassium channel subfamily K member 13-like n=1 Tax=Scophthalmus maximus TaxID=52904 RepID=A0A2U9B4V6_SCOMX|nr:putative potassium channel subfamily K member 13-like [Scophthalmus maximus]
MKKDSVCCPPSLIPSRETSLFYLLGVLIALYMLAGAAVFSSLERPAELQAHQLWENRLRDFSHEHRVSCEDLKHLLSLYEEARTAGIRTKQGRALWDISGAFYFVGTVVSTIVACGAASLYSVMEGWTYFESLYFCFVAFSTVGFGDFVSGQREHHEDTWVYQVANCLLMLLGVCCTYSLFNAISVIIKQGLNWILKTLALMCQGENSFHFSPQYAVALLCSQCHW